MWEHLQAMTSPRLASYTDMPPDRQPNTTASMTHQHVSNMMLLCSLQDAIVSFSPAICLWVIATSLGLHDQ
eukprot:11609016-Prorocentrum_lima.AAC.1